MSQHPTPEQLEAALKVIDTQAGMLIATADRANALQRENADEHQARLKYQGLVYLVCAELDHALGRHVSNGTGTLADEESVMKAIRLLAAKLAAAEAALNETYVDENCTTWTRPTAYAYAMACKALDRAKQAIDAARGDKP